MALLGTDEPIAGFLCIEADTTNSTPMGHRREVGMTRNLVWSTLTVLALAGCAGESPTDPGGGGPGAAATVEITPGSVSFGAIGSSVTLTGVVKDASGTVLPGQAITWTVAAAGIVSVDAATGVLTSVANGSITVRGTA
jgi:hypothetical protein